MRAHRLALGLGAVVLVIGAGLAAAIVAIATGGSGRDAAVFSRTAKLTTARGEVGNGLTLDGGALVAKKANGKQTLGSLGGGDEVIAPLTGSLTPSRPRAKTVPSSSTRPGGSSRGSSRMHEDRDW